MKRRGTEKEGIRERSKIEKGRKEVRKRDTERKRGRREEKERKSVISSSIQAPSAGEIIRYLTRPGRMIQIHKQHLDMHPLRKYWGRNE